MLRATFLLIFLLVPCVYSQDEDPGYVYLTDMGETSCLVLWNITKPPTVTGYKLIVNRKINPVDANMGSVRVENLKPNKQFCATLYDSAQEAVSEACGSTLSPVGPTPTIEALLVTNETIKIQLSIDDSTNAGKFQYFEISHNGETPERIPWTLRALETKEYTTVGFEEHTFEAWTVNNDFNGGGRGNSSTLLVRAKPDAGQAPRNVKARVTGESTISLTWEHPEHSRGVIKTYRFRVNGTDFDRTPDGNATTLQLTGLQPFSTYRLEIATENEMIDEFGGLGAYGTFEPAVVTTWPAVGPTPTCQDPTVTKDSVTISWTLPDAPINGELKNFEVTITGPVGFTETKAVQPLAMTTSFTNLTAFTKYSISVVAVNKPVDVSGQGGGPGKPCISKAHTPPSAGATPVCEPKLALNASVTFEWHLTNVTNHGVVTAFHLTIEGPWIDIKTDIVNGAIFSYTFGGLEAFKDYDVSVATENERDATSDQSGGLGTPCKLTMKTLPSGSFTPVPDESQPPVISATAITVHWKKPEEFEGEIVGFRLTAKRESARSIITVEVPASATSATIDNLESDQTYAVFIISLVKSTVEGLEPVASESILLGSYRTLEDGTRNTGPTLGMIIGIVAGVVVSVAIVSCLVGVVVRKRRRGHAIKI